MLISRKALFNFTCALFLFFLFRWTNWFFHSGWDFLKTRIKARNLYHVMCFKHVRSNWKFGVEPPKKFWKLLQLSYKILHWFFDQNQNGIQMRSTFCILVGLVERPLYFPKCKVLIERRLLLDQVSAWKAKHDRNLVRGILMQVYRCFLLFSFCNRKKYSVEWSMCTGMNVQEKQRFYRWKITENKGKQRFY